jgi:DNA-binding NarL/FixJ family response regulator
MFAEGLKTLLETEEDLQVCGKAGTAAETLEKLADCKPEVLLLDINMPDRSGMDLLPDLHKQFPELKIMALTMHNDESYITTMLGQGVQGYLLKNTGKEELVTAIRTIQEGKTYICQEAADTMRRGLVNARKAAEAPTAPKISRREKEVLRLIMDECTTQEIAAQLFVSEKTVESHRAALLTKLGARNTAGMVKAALQWKILED